MDESFVKKNVKPVLRMLQILCIYVEYKMHEVSHNFNKCPKCESIVKEYEIKKMPRSKLNSFGDSPSHFNCNGLIFWSIPCPECGEETNVATQYTHDIQKGCTVKKIDFFMDYNGWYGHNDY